MAEERLVLFPGIWTSILDNATAGLKLGRYFLAILVSGFQQVQCRKDTSGGGPQTGIC